MRHLTQNSLKLNLFFKNDQLELNLIEHKEFKFTFQ